VREWAASRNGVRAAITFYNVDILNGMNRTALSAAIASVSALSGQFVLRSGAMATEYFDKYRFEGDPKLLAAVAEHLEALIPPSEGGVVGNAIMK